MDKKEWISIDFEFIDFLDEDIVTTSDNSQTGNVGGNTETTYEGEFGDN